MCGQQRKLKNIVNYKNLQIATWKTMTALNGGGGGMPLREYEFGREI